SANHGDASGGADKPRPADPSVAVTDPSVVSRGLSAPRSPHPANASTARTTPTRRIADISTQKKGGPEGPPCSGGSADAEPALQPSSLVARDDEVALLRALGPGAAEDLVVDADVLER